MSIDKIAAKQASEALNIIMVAGAESHSTGFIAVLESAVSILHKAAEGEIREVVDCDKCKYSKYARTVAYGYRCNNENSPCRGRVTFANFGCTYGERKTVPPDA